jgi:hypothetical protein
VASSPDAGEDTRVWIARLQPGKEQEQRQFIDWLNTAEAHAIFRRRRLTEYTLSELDGSVTLVFKAPHTGDPRLIIDFLRYPGLWPDYWEFVRGGRAEDEPPPDLPDSAIKVHWRHDQPNDT